MAKVEAAAKSAQETGQSLEQFKESVRSRAGDKIEKIEPYLEELDRQCSETD